MDIVEAIKNLVEQGRVVRDAPVLFIISVATIGSVIWVILSWSYGSIISVKNETIALYEAKLKVGSPDEAAKKLETLQNAIEELKRYRWRSLTPLEITQLSNRFRGLGKKRVTIYAEEGVATALSNGFKEAFTKADWVVGHRKSIFPLERGIVTYPENELASELQKAIRSITLFEVERHPHSNVADEDVVLSIGPIE